MHARGESQDRSCEGLALRLELVRYDSFQLDLPQYSSADVLAERLRYAIYNCRGIDTDGEGNAAAWR